MDDFDDFDMKIINAMKTNKAKSIGSGTYGVVSRLTFEDGEVYVVKVPVERISPVGLKQFQRESKILKIFEAKCEPYLLCFKRLIEDDEGKLYLVTKNVERKIEMFDVLYDIAQFDVTRQKTLFQNLIAGLQTLHNLGVAHCDIKPENILVSTGDCSITYIDFGASCMDGKDYYVKCGDICGTPTFAGPELYTCERNFEDMKQLDMWALGLVIWECVTNDQKSTLPKLYDDIDLENISIQDWLNSTTEWWTNCLSEHKAKLILFEERGINIEALIALDPKSRSLEKALCKPSRIPLEIE